MTAVSAATSAAALPPPSTPDGSSPPPAPPGQQAPATSSDVKSSAKNVGSNIISWVKSHESAVEIGGLTLAGGAVGFLTMGPVGAAAGAAAGAIGGALLVKHQNASKTAQQAA